MRTWCLLTTCRCYLGGAGIAEAFRQGADIVICGRVADAAPTIGAAIYHHGWDKDKDFDQVAGALVAGHLIECSSYVTGGYYSGFKELFDGCENVGFPIAEIFADGSFALIKEEGTGGEISVGTLTSQLVYEIQGPQYYGSDVVAVLEGINMKQEGKDRGACNGSEGKASADYNESWTHSCWWLPSRISLSLRGFGSRTKSRMD